MRFAFLNRWKNSLLSKPGRYQALILTLIAVVSFFLALKMFLLVDRFAVNLIFLDQFDFMIPLFPPNNVWTMFSIQHGPHRQGLGELITWIVTRLSGWNTRAEAFTIMGTLWICLPLVLLLKRKLFGCFHLMDVVIPIIVLNKYQWEQFINTPNISHSVLPLLLVFLYTLSWLISNKPLRYAAVLTVNFLLLFTGFGVFMGMVTLGIFILELIVSLFRNRSYVIYSIVGLMGVLFSLRVFAKGYVFQSAVDCFELNWSQVLNYPSFVAMMLAKFSGFGLIQDDLLPLFVGRFLFIAFLAMLLWHAWKYLRDPFRSDPSSKIIVILIGFSLIFAFSTAAGRICVSLSSSQNTRYMTLLIPGFVGMLFGIYKIPAPKVAFVLYLVLTFLLLRTLLPFPQTEQASIHSYHNVKESWKACYLELGDFEQCNQRSGFDIYPPYPGYKERIDQELDFLKQNHLNLYQDSLVEK